MTNRYVKSQETLERALKTVPLGSQTFSKSKTQFPYGVSPYFIQKAQGSHVWDVDNNEYIDFMNSLLAITLGYNDPDVNKAVKHQLELGTLFSLPHPLEFEVAEKIVEMVPCAEKVRFGKNGSDATAGAIRLARAYTNKDHVIVCGYHGWQDWYIGSTARNLGVPKATIDLTHAFMYNDIESLHKVFKEYPDQIASVIMEPMNLHYPKEGFLQEVKEITHKNGALLIFDETITGFRYSKGGAQELFNVIPDLATFGKGLANGYPISAVAGSDKYMHLMEEIFFSFTFGGETLSLAAALATLNKLQNQPILETIKTQGQKVIIELNNLIQKHELTDVFSVAGHPTWSFFVIKDIEPYTSWDIKTLYLQEMFRRGILTITTNNMSYSHSDEDLSKLFKAYDEVLALLKEAIQNKKIENYLNCKPLEPLFKVR